VHDSGCRLVGSLGYHLAFPNAFYRNFRWSKAGCYRGEGGREREIGEEKCEEGRNEGTKEQTN
jgi:hypothetical protein